LLRIFPAFSYFSLGVVNIVSAHLPAISNRLNFLREFLPDDAIQFSGFTVIVLGVVLILLSANLIRGLKNAWIAAVIMVALSMIGHITKAGDYEEASFAALVLLILLYTRKNYIVKSDKHFFQLTDGTILPHALYPNIWNCGILYHGQKTFRDEFYLAQSAEYLLNSLILLNNDILPPHTPFGHGFVFSLNVLGGFFWAFTLFIVFKPYRHRHENDHEELVKATGLIKLNGKSALDYFKVYPDKSIYFCSNQQSIVSFKIHNEYAMVLEGPTYHSKEELPALIEEFDNFCQKNGLKSMYYRVDEEQLPIFHKLKKKSIFIGQEGIVDIAGFSLEGGDRKPLRNGINKVKGQVFNV
jgi:phosphatidylglycerol lysyltransferase